MALRILDDTDLKNMSAVCRLQVEKLTKDVQTEAQVNHINRYEEDVGRALTTWIDSLVMPSGLRPGLFWYHVPNGLARTAAQGGIFKAQGLRKGWPDYCLDLPLGEYHGFRMEIKSEHGAKPTTDQLDILARLESVGFKCAVAWGFDDAQEQIKRYLDLARGTPAA